MKRGGISKSVRQAFSEQFGEGKGLQATVDLGWWDLFIDSEY